MENHDRRHRDLLQNHLEQHQAALQDDRNLMSHTERQRRRQLADLVQRQLMRMEEETEQEKIDRYEATLQTFYEMNNLDDIDFHATGL